MSEKPATISLSGVIDLAWNMQFYDSEGYDTFLLGDSRGVQRIRIVIGMLSRLAGPSDKSYSGKCGDKKCAMDAIQAVKTVSLNWWYVRTVVKRTF